MRDSKEIKIKLTGPGGEAPRFSDFDNVCNALRSVLSHLERCILGAEQKLDYEIGSLEYASAGIGIRPGSHVDANGGFEKVRSTFYETIDHIQHGKQIDQRLDYKAIKAFGKFFSPLKSTKSSLQIGRTVLTEDFGINMSRLLEPNKSLEGQVSGRLESLSIHGRSKFVLYPVICNDEIPCKFAKDRLPAVLNSVDKIVTVFGTLFYSRGRINPVRVDVKSFDTHPADSALSDLLDARGIAKNDMPDWDAVLKARDDADE